MNSKTASCALPCEFTSPILALVREALSRIIAIIAPGLTTEAVAATVGCPLKAVEYVIVTSPVPFRVAVNPEPARMVPFVFTVPRRILSVSGPETLLAFV